MGANHLVFIVLLAVSACYGKPPVEAVQQKESSSAVKSTDAVPIEPVPIEAVLVEAVPVEAAESAAAGEPAPVETAQVVVDDQQDTVELSTFSNISVSTFNTQLGVTSNIWRLVPGGTNTVYAYGRVEVFYAGQWGTVSDDGFTLNEANMVCRALGHAGTYWSSEWYTVASSARGSGPIWLDNLNCPSCATTVEHCTHKGWGVHDDTHTEDVGVHCLRQTGQCKL